MSVTPLHMNGWRGRGCGPDCLPRSHDPIAHERFGYEQAQAAIRGIVVRTGNLVVNLTDATVQVDGVPIFLSDREWQVLAYLAGRCGHPCRMPDITSAVYGQSTRFEERNLNHVVWQLRAKLGTAGGLITAGRSNGGPMRRLERVEVAP